MTVPYRSTVMTGDGSSDAAPRTAVTLARRPLLLAGLGAATISFSPIFVVLSGASAVSTAFYRSVIALPVLLVLGAVEQRRLGRRSLAARLLAALAGAFLAADLIMWAHAIADVGAGVATVLGNLQVLFVIGFTWLIWHERPNRAAVLALPVVMAGVVLVSGLAGKHTAGTHPLAGVCYGLGTSIAYAGYLVTLRRACANSPHAAGPVADASASAALTSLLIGLCIGGLAVRPLWPALGWLAVLALVSQVGGWSLISSSLPKLPAAISSLILLLQPAGSLMLGTVILAERITLLQIIGAVLTCAGVVGASGATADQRLPANTEDQPRYHPSDPR